MLSDKINISVSEIGNLTRPLLHVQKTTLGNEPGLASMHRPQTQNIGVVDSAAAKISEITARSLEVAPADIRCFPRLPAQWA